MVVEIMLTLVLCVILTAVIGLFLIWLHVIRNPSHIKVNCWFCNEDTVVPYGNKDCWDCPHCEQYNGFDEEGDYNKPIPAQRQQNLNHSVVTDYHQQYSEPSNHGNSSNNLLCEECNRNQLLKVKQLALFVPHSEANFDNEIEVYQHHLEQIYKLCLRCELVLQQELRQQTQQIQSRVLGRRLKESSVKDVNTSLSKSVTTTPWTVSTLRLLAVIFAFVSFVGKLNRNYGNQSNFVMPSLLGNFLHIIITIFQIFQSCTWILTLCGMSSTMSSILIAGKDRLSVADSLSLLLWILLLTWQLQLDLRLTMASLFVCIYCLLQKRSRSRDMPRSMRRRRSYTSLSNTSMSSLSCDSTPGSSLADESEVMGSQDFVFLSSSNQKDQHHNFETQSVKSFTSTNHERGLGGFLATPSIKTSMSANQRTAFDNCSIAPSFKSSVSTNQRGGFNSYTAVPPIWPSVSANQRTGFHSYTAVPPVWPSVSANHRTGFDNYSSSSGGCVVSTNQSTGLDSSFTSSFSINSEPEKKELDNTLDAMSLGPPHSKKKKDSGMWSAYATQYSTTTMDTSTLSTPMSSLRKQKPLISPARLTLSEMKVVPTQVSRVTTSKQLFSSSVKEQDSVESQSSSSSHSNSSDSNHSNHSDSGQSSPCDVDTTNRPHTEGHQQWQWRVVMLLSIGVNLFLVMYLITSNLGKLSYLNTS
ncbi:uncharacterized protein LOC144451568 isoform X2 [Glandiceps talaboti]